MHPRPSHHGFSLVELIAAVAIVAILSSILIPTAAAAHRSAGIARTRLQWAQWGAAIEAYRLEYGVYPTFHVSNKVNGGASAAPGGPHPFADILAGRAAENFRQIRFLSFAERDWAGSSSGLLCDGLGSTDIAVVVDRNADGLVDAVDCGEWPAVAPPGSARQLRPGPAELGGSGVRASAIFYSAPPGAVDSSQLILSWR